MNNIRCLIVDDEPLALKQMEAYVGKVPGVEIVGKCSSALAALQIINNEEVDLLFSDISMPDMNGIELVRQVADRCFIVFTTAYSEYALEGYKVEAVDYLLKPFGLSDVVSAVEKVRRRMEKRVAEQSADIVDDYIYIKNDSKMSKVKIADIALVEGLSEYVRVYVEGEQRPLTTLLSMRKAEETLPSDSFMRVHRSWIVNLNKIQSISHLRISIAGQLVPISDSYKDKFMEYVEGRLLK